MKIIVKSKDINLKLYVPMFILTSGVRLTKFINKFHTQNDNLDRDIENTTKYIEYIEYIDMDVIVYAIKELKAYKGLTLIEVKANDGTYVLIKV